MSETPIQIQDVQAEGYHPVVDYDAWRVAVLNYIDELLPENIDSVQQHAETDEVFVLLAGWTKGAAGLFFLPSLAIAYLFTNRGRKALLKRRFWLVAFSTLLGILSSVPMTYATNEQQNEITTSLRNALKGKR